MASPQTPPPNPVRTVAATNNSKCACKSEIRIQVNQPPTNAPKAVAATKSSKCACESKIRMQVNQQPQNPPTDVPKAVDATRNSKCACESEIRSNQQPLTPSAPVDQDSSKRETSYLGDFYRWSRESKTTRTKSQFKVSFHQERRIGTTNWALFSSNEETVKYTEVQYANKNGKDIGKTKPKIWHGC